MTREISVDLTPQVQVGDYVLVHAGFAIEVVDEQFALETIDLVKQFPRAGRFEQAPCRPKEGRMKKSRPSYRKTALHHINRSNVKQSCPVPRAFRLSVFYTLEGVS